MPEPDEDRDVIIHFFVGNGEDVWTLWLGFDKQSEYPNLVDATEAARKLAGKTGRPIWLRDETGYPLKPVEP